MVKRVAIVTDTISSSFYFPAWYRYYANQFGGENIHIVTLQKEVHNFKDFILGSITEVNNFNNSVRVDIVNSLVEHLLKSYDVICRVDTDEFLVADPRNFKTVADYIETLEFSHVTAYGFNIIPDLGQLALDLQKPLLYHQRNIAYPYDALCKTCITTVPLHWTPGFHFCSERPQFDKLFLFHTKLADFDIQIEIGKKAANSSDEDMFIEYHSTPKDILEQRANQIRSSAPRVYGTDSLYRTEYIQKFLSGIHYTDAFGGVYHGEAFSAELILVEIDSEFGTTF